jgi:hypothetical protein
MNYWIFKDGKALGPYAESQLRTMWQNGIITADALCCKEGEETWLPVSNVVSGEKSVSTPPLPSLQTRAPRPQSQTRLTTYNKDALLKIVSYREAMVSAYLISIVFTILARFVDAPIMVFIAMLAWLGVAVSFVAIVRSLNGGVFASILAFIAAFTPLVCLVTAFFLYGWAERELKDAGVKIASAGRMKNQIRSM